MATMIPNSPLIFEDRKYRGEKQVFNALKNLDEHCYVFHSVNWIRDRDDRREKPEGEIDFIVFDPSKGILVVEVKGGNITYNQEQKKLYQDTEEGRKKIDPERQADISMYVLRQKLKDSGCYQHEQGEKLLFGHIVWFPTISYPYTEGLPPKYTKEMLLDRESLKKPQESILEAYAFWRKKYGETRLSAKSVKAIVALIAETFELIPSIGYEYELREQQFIRMTQEQSLVIEFLDEQKTAVVSGSAGTGKTILALEKARRLSATGESVLFLSVTSGLKDFLKTKNDLANVEFLNFDGLVWKYIKRYIREFYGNKTFDDLEKLPKHKKYNKAKEYFLELLSNNSSNQKIGWSYKHLIIDEGQDFESEWIEHLYNRIEGCFYVFLDPNQLVLKDSLSDWVQTAPCKLVLTRNCRNTLQIAKTSYQCINLAIKDESKLVSGKNAKLYEFQENADAGRKIIEIIRNLREISELEPWEIAILTMEGTEKSIVSDLIVAEENEFLYSGADIDGIPVGSTLNSSGICFTTVRKFKGLEAKAVILVDVSLDEFGDEKWRKLFYTACSRAVHELHIVLKDVSEKAINSAIESIAPGNSTQSSREGLAEILYADWGN